MFAFQLRFRAWMQALIPMSMSVSNGFLDPALQEMMRSTDLRRCYNPRTSLSCLVDDLSLLLFPIIIIIIITTIIILFYFILLFFHLILPHCTLLQETFVQ